jgi:P-type E1-E2 ATPase
MPTYEIAGWGTLTLSNLVLDLNGTVAIDGELVPGVAERVAALAGGGMTCYLLTADTRGRGAETARKLGVTLRRLDPGDECAQKSDFVRDLDAREVVAIGNGANDAAMLRAASLGIAVIQAEGTAQAALSAADVIVPDICAALDLLLKPDRLRATTRR